MDGFGCLKTVQSLRINIMGPHIKQNPFQRQEALRFEVETATFAYEQYRDSLGETDSATIAAKQNMERYQEEYQETTAEVTKLECQVKALQKTMQNSADTVSKATTDLNNAKAGVRETEAEIRRLTEQLYRMQSAWTQAGEALTAIGKKSAPSSADSASSVPAAGLVARWFAAGPVYKKPESQFFAVQAVSAFR